jgi:hypothetical protein
MRRASLLVAGAVLAAACGTAHGTTVTTASASCAPSAAHKLASNKHAAIYSQQGAVYACDAATGKRTRLGSATVCIGTARVENPMLAGAIAAYGVETCGVDTGGASVVVRRLSDGKQLKSYPAITVGLLPESYASIGSLAVKRDGSVAWIASNHSIIGKGTSIAVYRNGSLLDSGSAIKPSSLRLKRSRLSWQDGSQTRTAKLS